MDSIKKVYLINIIAMICLIFIAPYAISSGNSGTWKDPSSGLTWKVFPHEKTMSWQEAWVHCRYLNYGGFSDWHLPTISELRGLIRNRTKGAHWPQSISGPDGQYWSSTQESDRDGTFQGVDFTSGKVIQIYISAPACVDTTAYVRCVR